MPAAAVAPGETLLLYHDERATYLVPFKPGGRFECHLGIVVFPENLVWGALLTFSKGARAAVLRPSHSDVQLLLKRRTTVVYPKEAGKAIMELGVRAGGRYGECGSGSGAMTMLLASLVGPEGKVYSRERHPEHLAQARKNIERLGLSERVDFAQCDPAREGFGVTGLDGLFIDVPEPWLLVAAGAEALGEGGIWVSLSPTIDQAVRTERELCDYGFVRRRLSETLERSWKLFPGRVRPEDRMVGHTAFLLVAHKIAGRDASGLEARRRR